MLQLNKRSVSKWHSAPPGGSRHQTLWGFPQEPPQGKCPNPGEAPEVRLHAPYIVVESETFQRLRYLSE